MTSYDERTARVIELVASVSGEPHPPARDGARDHLRREHGPPVDRNGDAADREPFLTRSADDPRPRQDTTRAAASTTHTEPRHPSRVLLAATLGFASPLMVGAILLSNSGLALAIGMIVLALMMGRFWPYRHEP